MVVPRTGNTPKARPRCQRCQRAIHVPAGWSHGPAVRRHYWRKHRDVMLARLGGNK